MHERPRIGIVGARRARQGLGPFVAKWLARHGADVVAHAGTSAETVAAATADLARLAGVDARGHVGLDALLAQEALDAVAILSPPEHHGEALDTCLAAGLHVLCEKPLLLPRSGGAAEVARVRAFEDGFAARGLVLAENCQWPRVLPTYRALYPRSAEIPRAFAMGLEPASRGAAMLTDALSHPLSLLQALLGDELTVAAIAVDRAEGPAEPEAYDLEFRALGPRGELTASVALRHVPVQPRRAWFALDGLRAERALRLSDYSMSLCGDGREVPLPDPLELHLAAFVREIEARRGSAGAARPPSRALSARMAALAALVEACLTA